MTAVIERTLELETPIEDTWRALTDPTELSGWFGDSAEFSPEVGSQGWFGWEKHGRYAMRVEEFEPPRRFVWRWARDAGKDLDETPSTLVEWTLTPRANGGTTLHLRESGFVRREDFEGNDRGWTQELGELVEYLSRL